MRWLSFLSLLLVTLGLAAIAQDQSVKPGINDSFKNPDVAKYQKTFEGESREVYVNREKLVAACGIKPGMIVADVGAGTGMLTRLFSKAVGTDGQVYAVDIATNFVEHIRKTSRAAGLKNITPVLCNEDAVDLPMNSIDLAFTCDTYHHFEFPQRTLASIHRALKPGGRLIVVDFHRIPGKSSDWTLNHVRASQEIVEKEIASAGFKKTEEVKDLLKDNYMVVFSKSNPVEQPKQPRTAPSPLSPVVPSYGLVVPLPNGAEHPAKGSKVVFDITSMGKDVAKPLPGLERVATLLNLAGMSGLKPTDLEVAVVLHGDATLTALDDGAYQSATGQTHPSSDLLAKLAKAGVKVMVCGQSLERKKLDAKRVRPGVGIAVSAVTAVINLQSRGFAYVPAQN